MPQESMGRSWGGEEKRGVELGFAERREALFREIEGLSKKLRKDQVVSIVSRVLEHSLEDGIRLAERLSFTPTDYQAAFFTVGVMAKHPAVYRKVAEEDGKLATQKVREDEVFHAHVENLSQYVGGITASPLTPRGETRLRREQAQRLLKSPPYPQIDELYVSSFMDRRSVKVKPEKIQEVDTQTKGERAADRYLFGLEQVMERRFYTGPVKERLRKIENDPLLRQSTILEKDLRALCKINQMKDADIEAMIAQLAPARVVAFRQLDALKRRAVVADLLVEIREKLPEHLTVEYDREADEYQVVEREEQEKNPFLEARRERLRVFEEKTLDELERLLDEGTHRLEIAHSLAGLDSERAWKLRERIFEMDQQKGYWYVVSSLVGVDSEIAWTWRRKLLDQRAFKGRVASFLGGCESPQAFQLREEALADGWMSARDAAIGLAGCDSPRAWAMREWLFSERPHLINDVGFYSLIGLDSPRAWAMRGRFLDHGFSHESAALCLAGLDSEFAWKMRDEFWESGKVSVNAMILSLSGLDSERARQRRKWYCEHGASGEAFAESLVGLDSDDDWKLRKNLELQGVQKSAIARGMTGDNLSFVWRLRPEWKEAKVLAQETWNHDIMRLKNFEKRSVGELRRIFQEGETPLSQIAQGLAGCDSAEAWKLRDDLIATLGAEMRFLVIAESIRGVDSARAWQIREDFFRRASDVGMVEIVEGLAGLDSRPAWEMRERAEGRVDQQSIIRSLAGLDSARAWVMRKKYLTEVKDLQTVALSLYGLDSAEAWEMRERILLMTEEPSQKNWVLLSLAGLDSDEAWEMRERFSDGACLVENLMCLDSSRAWKIRERLRNLVAPEEMLRSLAGCDSPRAWEWRRELELQSLDAGGVANSFMSGGSVGFLWRNRSNWPDVQERVNVDPPYQPTLDLLNLVLHPTVEGIREREQNIGARTSRKQRIPPDALSLFLERAMSEKDIAKDFLNVNPAVLDRDPNRMAQDLLRRMLPKRAAATRPPLWRRVVSGLSPLFSSSAELSEVSSVFQARETSELVGGGMENLRDSRKVLEARQPIHALLVSAIYGSYNPNKKRWEKVYFPVQHEVSDPAQQTTCSVLEVVPGTRVSLLSPPDAKVLSERVKGLMADGREVSLNCSLNGLGEATVDVPAGVSAIVYSFERSLVPVPLYDLSHQDFERFVRKLPSLGAEGMTTRIAKLPHDIIAQVRTEVFRKLSPKEQVESIEKLVRSVFYYDRSNEETRAEKTSKTVEERVLICERRLEELQKRSRDPALQGKRFAGVCADAALITASLLREAGIPAGILEGLQINGKVARMRDNHSTAFVPWPTEEGGIRLIPVDGTSAAVVGDVRIVPQPLLADLDRGVRAETAREVAVAHETIMSLLTTTRARDLETLHELSNGKLERALNVILQYEVKHVHLRVIERMLDAYWYGGLARLEGLEREVGLRKVLAEEIERELLESFPQDTKPAGTKLLDTIRAFLVKAGRGKEKSAEAFRILEDIIEIIRPELADVEECALTVVIAYLKAERMG